MNVWDRNQGRFAVPSSAVPVSRAIAAGSTGRGRAGDLARRVAEAQRAGCVAIGADTIVARIDQAIVRLSQSGRGDPRYITLTEPDMLAFAEVTKSAEYRDYRVSIGAQSMVYGRNGGQRVYKTVRPR